MARKKLISGMVVYWQDPAGIESPTIDTSCYDIIYDVDYDNGVGMLGYGTEVLLSECRPLTDDELTKYSSLVNAQVYPDQL